MAGVVGTLGSAIVVAILIAVDEFR